MQQPERDRGQDNSPGRTERAHQYRLQKSPKRQFLAKETADLVAIDAGQLPSSPMDVFGQLA